MIARGPHKTVSQHQLRFSLRLINGVLRCVRPLGVSWERLDEEKLKREASRRTGLADFGADHHREPLLRLIDNVHQSPAEPLAQISVHEQLTQHLMNRLKITDFCRRHPAVGTIQIDRPIFIVGLPRTGTTMLQNLLSLHPQRHSPPFWWLKDPVPAYGDLARSDATRRRRIWFLAWLNNYAAPEQAKIHNIQADSVEECWHLFFNRFTSLSYGFGLGLHHYGRWLLQTSMLDTYQEYHRQLQLLQYQYRPETIVMKCVEHIWFLDSLFKTFPDARVIWAHRDPFASIASYASYISMYLRIMYGRCQRKKTGQYLHEMFLAGVNRGMAARFRLDKEAQIIDVHWHDLRNRPLEVVGAIADKFGLSHDVADVASMQNWLDADRSDAAGKHYYRAEDYGLNRSEVARDFAPYTDRFGITPTEHTVSAGERATLESGLAYPKSSHI